MRQVEWLNSNAYRRYPFVEDESLVLSGGTLTMDDSVIVDFRGVSYLYTNQAVRLLQVTIIPGIVNQGAFMFTYVGAPAVYNPFTFLVSANAAIPYVATVHNALAHHVSCVFGPGLAAFLQNPGGTYVFDTPPQIEPALMAYQPTHRVTNVVGTKTGSVDLNNGNIFLEEGHNCQIDLNFYNNALTISAFRGAGAGVDCTPITSTVLLCKDILMRINGLHGNDQGDYIIGGMNGVEVEALPDDHTVVVRSTQADEKPCGD